MRFLPRFLRGGVDELGWDDLVKQVVKALAKLGRYGARGRVVFPPDAIVRIEVAEGSVGSVRDFVAKLEFDAEVAAALANESDCAVSELPEREYVVVAADATRVVATEGAPRVWVARIEGGDFSGREVVLQTTRSEVAFGRGPYHGTGQDLRNDIVVCEKTEFVSRRAGRLRLVGSKLEIESLDQGDGLVVKRSNGESLRPSRTAKGRVALESGDALEFVDPKGASVRLVFTRKTSEEDANRGSDRS